MGWDIESFVCAAAVVIIGFAFRSIVYTLGELPSCMWLGWFFVGFSVVVALFMIVEDEI